MGRGLERRRRARGIRSRGWGAIGWLTHPMHLILGFFVVALGLITGLGWVLLTLFVADVALALALGRTAMVTRWLDQRDAERLRRQLWSRMDGDHRAELRQLEQAVAEVRGLPAVLDDAVDLDGLVETYARLAVVCAESRRLLGRCACAPPVDGGLRPLPLPPPGVRLAGSDEGSLRARRAELAALRVERHQRARHDTEEIEQQLGVIADVVMLIQQQAVASTCHQHARARSAELAELASALRDAGDIHADAQAEMEAVSAD